MSHNIHTKQKVYGIGSDPMAGGDYCGGEIPTDGPKRYHKADVEKSEKKPKKVDIQGGPRYA